MLLAVPVVHQGECDPRLGVAAEGHLALTGASGDRPRWVREEPDELVDADRRGGQRGLGGEPRDAEIAGERGLQVRDPRGYRGPCGARGGWNERRGSSGIGEEPEQVGAQ